MKKGPDWKSELLDNERDELERAILARDASSSVLRETTKKLKSRCIKRLHRKRVKDGN